MRAVDGGQKELKVFKEAGKEGAQMRKKFWSQRVLEVIGIGLLGLLLFVAGPGAGTVTAWADGGHHPPSESSPGEPDPSGKVRFPTPFIVGITGLLIDEVTDCETGKRIPPEKLTAEFVFREEAKPPFKFEDLEKIVLKAEGYQPREIRSFMTMQFQLGFLVFTFIIPLEGEICLLQQQPQQRCLRALLVGVEEDQSRQRQQELNNTVRRALRGLQRNWGFRQNEIMQLINQRATKRNILNALNTLDQRFDRRGCTIKIHIFGHGIRDNVQRLLPGARSGPDNPNNGDLDEGFVAWGTDGNPQQVSASDVLWDHELINALRRFQNAQVIVQLDFCYSQGMFENWSRQARSGRWSATMPQNLFIAWAAGENNQCLIRTQVPGGPTTRIGWAWTQAVLLEGFNNLSRPVTIQAIHQYPQRRNLDTARFNPGFRDGSTIGSRQLPLP